MTSARQNAGAHGTGSCALRRYTIRDVVLVEDEGTAPRTPARVSSASVEKTPRRATAAIQQDPPRRPRPGWEPRSRESESRTPRARPNGASPAELGSPVDREGIEVPGRGDARNGRWTVVRVMTLFAVAGTWVAQVNSPHLERRTERVHGSIKHDSVTPADSEHVDVIVALGSPGSKFVVSIPGLWPQDTDQSDHFGARSRSRCPAAVVAGRGHAEQNVRTRARRRFADLVLAPGPRVRTLRR